MPKGRNSCYSACINAANSNSWQKSICARKRIPEVKTIEQYGIALEEAVYEMFVLQNDDYIVDLLEDAVSNKKWPKDYLSSEEKQFFLCDNFFVKSARFYIKGGIRIIMKKIGFEMTITSKKVEFQPFLKELIQPNVSKRVYDLQKVIQKIESFESKIKKK